MPSAPAPGAMTLAQSRRVAVSALVVCVLALAAAAVSFAHGAWLGVVWLLLAGLASNMAWYYVRRARAARRLEEARRAAG